MIERLIEYSIRHRGVVIVMTLALAVWGLYSAYRTPVDAIPDLSENQLIVFTDWMGRSPREIEDQITYPLSVNLQGLAGVKAVRSSSEFNFSMINIIFDDSVDFYFARTRVLERLTLANTFLPAGVVPYLAPDATALGQIFWYTVEGDGYDAGRLRSIQDWFVRYQLNSVPGVAQVSTVGGFAKEYQVDVDPERLRAYNVTLGQLFAAIQKSNSAVGGRVVQKNQAEYLVRGVGWITSMDDIRDTVVTERNGIPIRVRDVATVNEGAQFRRSVLEKNGREAVGAVVMMRYGENPLDVTRRIHDKIRDVQKGLPQGVRIVPFYDRTDLIHGAIGTLTRTMIEELIVASLIVLLILAHFRSAVAVCVTLPLSVLASFILMRAFNIPSNIMSLSGIAISIGILVDQAVVMVENATHALTDRFGKERVTGDITEIVIPPCKQVGRPIFFSVVIMIVSFMPVFALTGMEGKMFHPLAFTKTFALVGVSLLAVTLVPAIIPILIRGRLSREDENPLVRSVIAVYKPVLLYLLHRPRLVIWLFVVLVSFGAYFWRQLGREFMPPLDELSILDMPITVPRTSVTQVADDLKVRDALIRQFPEVELVVGKAGRADTPTDPSPLDMVESVIGMRDRALWPRRKIVYDEALSEVSTLLGELEKSGAVTKKWTEAERRDFVNSVAMDVVTRFDGLMRREFLSRQQEYEQRLRGMSQDFLVDCVAGAIRDRAWKTKPDAAYVQALKDRIRSAEFPLLPTRTDVADAVGTIARQLVADGRIASLDAVPAVSSAWGSRIKSVLGFDSERFDEQAWQELQDFRRQSWHARMRDINWAIFDVGTKAFVADTLADVGKRAAEGRFWESGKQLSDQRVAQLQDDFARRVNFWQKNKQDIIQELDTEVRMLGWANIWTQPIINRVDMLATGVRTQIGVKVFGKSIDQIEAVSRQVADVLKGITGAVDVVADQNVGKGYVEIVIDRERAARYGVNVGDIQDIVEVALGGRPITTTVEGRERYPVRLRYARDFRTDEESIRRILITSFEGGGMAGGGGAMAPAAGGEMKSGANAAAGVPSAGRAESAKVQVHLSDVADVRVVEGPVMIKSENGLLRSYVQLNVRERDIVGFVEEAQRIVAEKVRLPEGSYLEWSGQFEHQVRARKTLQLVFPAVILLIMLILYMTYNDVTDAGLMMMAIPGALAGGVIFQTLFGFNFSVAVWVGYIACFGMATETGIIMLVYLRDAIDRRGGLERIGSLDELADAVVAGAVHRLRPKLLTEGTAILGIAPMLWATGVGAEVMRPIAAPVLGGLLVADEVIDVFLPVLFYHVRARRWKKLHGGGAGPEDAAEGRVSDR